MPPPSVGGAFSRQRSLATGRHRSQRRLAPERLSRKAIGDHSRQRRELRVVASVLEHRERHPGVGGGVDEPEGVVGVDRERLVDDDGDAGRDDLFGVLDVAAARGREHDDVETLDLQECVEVVDDEGVREVCGDLGPAVRVGRGHRGEARGPRPG